MACKQEGVHRCTASSKYCVPDMGYISRACNDVLGKGPSGLAGLD